MTRKIITLDLENPRTKMNQASGYTNPLLQPLHMVSAVSATTANNDDGLTRKSPPECKMPPEDCKALEKLQQAHHIIMPYEERQSQQKPCWFLEASREP
jgi:hypothetical protein